MQIDSADHGASHERPFGLDLSLVVFDRVTRVAKHLFSATDALVILVEDGVAWRSREPFGRFPRDRAAELVIAGGQLLWIEDAALDERFADNPLVIGPPFLRSYVAAPIRLEDGSTPGVLCAVAVVTQEFDPTKAARLQDLADLVADEWARAKAAQAREEAERRLMQAIAAAEAANTAKSQFLATMSHEIRTPLNGVLGMAQAMEGDELSERQRGRLSVIQESGQGLLAVLNDVLDISKIEAGKLELDEVAFDIDTVAESARHAFAALAETKGLALRLQVSPEAKGAYLGDATRVRQILYNLISNAVKFTERGAVSITVARRGDRVRLSVSDTGIGIARDDMHRLFQKFEQADASTTRRFGGSGLGLAICRQLAELMGGEIRARSQAGIGATFVVSLPLQRLGDAGLAPQAAAERPAEAPVEAANLRILAAEDNEINRLVLRALLAQVGFTPTIVADGRAALDAWEGGDWDLILMDVQMPRMDGPTATREIRRREAELGRPRTSIVALTANAMAHQVDDYLAACMDGFIAKRRSEGRSQLFAVLQRRSSRLGRRKRRAGYGDQCAVRVRFGWDPLGKLVAK